MAIRRLRTQSREKEPRCPGWTARHGEQRLTSFTVGALPILDWILQRTGLEEVLQAHLPREDRRSKVHVVRGIVLLVKNLLISREPLYGLGEWAARYAPQSLGLTPAQVEALNDDRVGRCLTSLFRAPRPALVLDLLRRVVREFQLNLDELHNDSTSISFFGAYADAAEEKQRRGQKTLAVTWGYSKDHRPDLKQLLYILTITADGGVPVHFRAASGNVTDDTTHRESWNLLCQIAGRRDFLYVADCKLATVENMNYVASHGGRFVSVLPRTRKEDRQFREQLRREGVAWQPLWEKTDEQGKVIDCFSIGDGPLVLPEGYRLWWFHSSRKAELDHIARTGRIARAEQHLRRLQEKLRSLRSRYREKGPVQDAVAKILQDADVERWIDVRVEEQRQIRYRANRPGRPSQNTVFTQEVSVRLDLHYAINAKQIAVDCQTDGIFPLVTNDPALSALEVLHAYKHQPQIERRFEHLKTDFPVAPVFLKDIGRIEALLCVYFFVLLVEALLERELRRAMQRDRIEALPMYPEARPCRRPTARRLIDLFEPLQRHTLHPPQGEPVTLVTELSPLQRELLRLLGLRATLYNP